MKKEMTDTEMYQLIEDFANSSSVAIGGNILVRRDNYSTGMTPKPPATGMKYEDTNYLSEIMHGAESFLWWLRRNGYKIRK